MNRHTLHGWRERHRSHEHILVYGSIALAVMLPLLRPGYIFSLDMVFTPEIPMPAHATSSYLFRAGLHILNMMLPSELIQKLLLFAVLVLSGVGTHGLMRHLRPAKAQESYGELWGTYLAGTLYMINPFTYSRFMAGQYTVLLGYALLPFFVRAILRFLADPGAKTVVPAVIWTLLISIVSIHTLGLAILISIIAGVLFAWRYRTHRGRPGTTLRYGLLGIGAVLMFSSYWLVPALSGNSATTDAISAFGAADRQAFATAGGSTVGRLGNVIRLQGFWAEERGLYLLPQDQLPAWGLIAIVIWVVAGMGAYAMWRRWKRSEALLFGACITFGVLLSVGVFSGWLSAHVPFFAGYREPQKFVGLIALGYAVFVGQGATDILRHHNERGRYGAANVSTIALLLIPVMFTPTMPWGFAGQLSPRDYPPEWYTFNERLNQYDGDFQTLILPWHRYTHFPFTGRIVAHPAEDFYDKPVLVSDDPEFKGASGYQSDPKKAALGRILASAPRRDDLGSRLAYFNVKYILLTKSVDDDAYDYLHHQKDLQLEAESDSLKLYRNDVYGEAR